MENNTENDQNEKSEEDLEKIEEINSQDEPDLQTDISLLKDYEENQIIESDSQANLTEEISEPTMLDEESLKDQMRMFHRNLVEASLYAAGRPLTIEEISTKLEFPKKEVEELVNEVAYDYLERNTALVIAQIGDRYQMQIRPEYTEKVSKFAKGGAIAERYLRTLTVIALKQPILKSMVIKLRGSGAYEHVKYLIDNGFINAVKKGRTHELTTTDKYADMFGLPKDRTQLKRAMVTQLGIEEISRDETPDEDEHYDRAETYSEVEPMHENEEEED
ncbi:MAG: SMC-Scp complex subunit ScpB [Promethearchaeota archaeon]|nr:MAG: SMC-Scp complex subunit ScpB [Candidatus Lokiarchaeota archaeon]